MEATLMIFSGRPNPRWRIDEPRAGEIRSAIAAMPEADAPAFAEEGLGYSGVALDFTDAGGRPSQAVFSRGTASIDGRTYVDADRRIERALLASGRDEVPEILHLL
jgi:hypothetical protein